MQEQQKAGRGAEAKSIGRSSARESGRMISRQAIQEQQKKVRQEAMRKITGAGNTARTVAKSCGTSGSTQNSSRKKEKSGKGSKFGKIWMIIVLLAALSPVIGDLGDVVEENQNDHDIATDSYFYSWDEDGYKYYSIAAGFGTAQAGVQFDYIEEILPKEIAFVSTQELVDMYPDLTPKEREYKIVKEKGAVFLMQVGKTLTNGERHDGRAPDYDDWELNGDILVYYPVLDIALELSSMGIRVDEESLDQQLTEAGCDDRRELPFQRAILNKELPYTIGGGIGQSRICMFFLRKAHIGEVHVSLWPESITKAAEEAGVNLL